MIAPHGLYTPGEKRDGNYKRILAELSGVVEYSDCFSAEWEESANECPIYDTKQFYGETLVMVEL